MPLLQLTDEETKYLTPVLAELSRGTGRQDPLTLQYLIDYWQGFVEEMESGYQRDMAAYVNDVTVRDILHHRVIQGAPAQLQIKVSLTLMPFDARFRSATQELDRPIRPAGDGSQRGWWWYRAPKNVHVTWR